MRTIPPHAHRDRRQRRRRRLLRRPAGRGRRRRHLPRARRASRGAARRAACASTARKATSHLPTSGHRRPGRQSARPTSSCSRSSSTTPSARSRCCRRSSGPDTVVIPLQNGVDSVAMVTRAVGATHTAGGTCYVSAVIAEPGVIKHTAMDHLIFGELDRPPLAAARRRFSRHAGPPAFQSTLSDDITSTSGPSSCGSRYSAA